LSQILWKSGVCSTPSHLHFAAFMSGFAHNIFIHPIPQFTPLAPPPPPGGIIKKKIHIFFLKKKFFKINKIKIKKR